jgi:uncharacterized protein YbaP (TraB family)
MKTPLAFLARTFVLAATALGAVAQLAVVPAPAPPPLNNYLWEVTSLTNRVYLFGTIHAGKASWFPLPVPIERALSDSRVVVVEADITNIEAMIKSSEVMMYTSPDKLERHVKPDDYARFRKLLGRYSIAENQIGTMKPFMAVSLLVFSEWGRLGYLPKHGIDLYVISKAKAEAKKLVEIEGIDTQVALMDSLTEDENRTIFAGTLTALESGTSSEQITGIVNAWQSGDPALLLEVARRYNTEVSGAKEFEEKFVWSRHDEMAGKIEGYLNNTRDRHFIAVGALHLAGPRGLVEMLRKRGYLVKQL